MRMSNVRIVIGNLDDDVQQAAVLALTDAYARDPMGMGKPLDDEVKQRLIPGLRAHPTTLVFLAYAGERALGMALCFRGFSSFRAQPLINVHDLSVLPEARGQGVGRMLLEAVIAHARQTDCCKVSLETQEANQRAQRLYRSLGFDEQVPGAGGAIFMTRAV
jgi:ribosomal protein S18 acetylase RimI-like enzyme